MNQYILEQVEDKPKHLLIIFLITAIFGFDSQVL